MRTERRIALREYCVVERAERVFAALLFFEVAAHLQHHELADRVQPIARIERAALGLASRGGFFEERLVAEESHPLFNREILAVQADGDDEPGQANERFGELSKLEGHIASAEPGFNHH